jgi:Rps23 Pro-64 3,4-dihydroxylase Tpa1-like proline 4-hydroxylase
MSETGEIARPIIPPCCVYQRFLDSYAREALLAWVIENEPKFKPTTVGTESKVDPSRRVSLKVHDFGSMKALLRQRVLDVVPMLIRDLGVTPFEVSRVELELIAHNDGAFFKPHIDTFTGAGRKASDRLLSGVYYFHAEPKAFSGGMLRFYPLKKGEDSFADVQPEQNTLVFFPSWIPHEVLPVSCPSKRFSDSRFAVNCWVHRKRSHRTQHGVDK